MKKYLYSLLIAALTLSGFIYYDHTKSKVANLGATCTKFVAALPTSLSGAGITTSVTSIGVTSATIKQTGQKLAITDFTCTGGPGAYLTLEPGNAARQEFSVCSGLTQNSNGTAVFTGCTRGLSPVYPYTASSTMQFTHGGGTTVIVSNSPPFYDTFANKTNDGTITGQYTFASTSLPQVALNTTNAQLTANGTNTLATLAFVASTSYSGTVDATVAVKGIVQAATVAEASSTTALAGGSTGASLGIMTNLIGATPFASGIVMAQSTGKILWGWIDTAATVTWSKLHTFTAGLTSSATTTLSGSSLNSNAIVVNGLSQQWPSANATGTMRNDGTGILSWGTPVKFSYAGAGPTVTTGSATTTLLTIPAGVMTASSTIELDWAGTSLRNGGGGTVFLAAVIGGATTTLASQGCDEGTNAETAQCTGHFLVSLTSVSAQRYSVTGTLETQGGIGTAVGSSGTTAVNFTNAATLVVWVQAQAASNDINVVSLAVTVNP